VLYLNDGLTPGGKRILPTGWVAYSRTSTLGSPYGAGFWTLDGPSAQAAGIARQGFPNDGFYASGNRGQRIYISPSEHLVIARFGYSGGEDQGLREDMHLLKTAIAVFKAPG
jgi:CubicO group peptidase (beta-lactamase class C family)